jgi:LEA14-like dessication related protein
MNKLATLTTIVVLAAVVYYLSAGLTSVHVDTATLTGVEDVTAESVTFSGQVNIVNPSWFTIPIQGGNYTVKLDDTDATLGNGIINGFELEPRTSTTASFSHEAELINFLDKTIPLLEQDTVMATIDGHVDVAIYGYTYTITYEKRHDVKRQLMHIMQHGNVLPDTPDF